MSNVVKRGVARTGTAHRTLFVLVFAAALAFAWAAQAQALVLTGPTASLGTAQFVVRVSSTDASGTVALLRDGRLWQKRPAVPGQTLVFPGVALYGKGDHVVTATLKTTAATISAVPIKVRVWAAPQTPVFVGMPAGLTGRKARVKVRVSADVTWAELLVNGRLVRRSAVRAGQVNDLGLVDMPGATNTIGLRAGNPAGATPIKSWSFARFTYPTGWSTCMVVVVSQLKLYWIHDDQLVKVYPVACGRPSLPTPAGWWRIGVKDHPGGAFGVARMRMFRLRGGRYYWTGYGIHGTDTESSIGTYASHGCIRLHNADIRELFAQVPIWTQVETR